MSKERPHLVNTKIAKYLEDQDIRRAYTVLYCHLLNSKEDGTKYFSQAELSFDHDPQLGPQKRTIGSVEAESFLEAERQKFEKSILGKKKNSIAKRIDNMNCLFLLMLLDLILRDIVGDDPISRSECYQVDGESFYLLTHKFSTNKDVKAKHQTGELKLIVRWNHVVRHKFNNYTINVHKIDPELVENLKAEISGNSSTLNIYSAEEHRVPYKWHMCQSSMRFHITGYELDDTPNQIVNALEHANSLNAHIVVFPELTIDENVREDVRTWLAFTDHKILLVVAGSWHVKLSKDAKGFVNESLMYDNMGKEVLRHRKTTTFSFKAKKTDKHAMHENIESHSHINLAMFPFGLSTLLICKDFCDLLSGVQETLKLCSPDFIFLPTMGDGHTLDAHDKAYNDQNVCIMPTLVCSNQTPDIAPGDENYPGRVYCGIHTLELNDGTLVRVESEPVLGIENPADNMDKTESNAKGHKKAPFAPLPEDKLFRLKLRT